MLSHHPFTKTEMWCPVKIYSGYSVGIKFEKRELAGDINILAALPGQWVFLKFINYFLDHFTKAYDNYLIMVDFNLEPHDKRFGYFLNNNNLVNLVKTNTCFKGSGYCIDLILRNRKYSFKNITSHKTGLSDHHHMILTMLKTTFQQKEPKCLIYRDYKNFIFENFKSDLQSYRAARAHMMHLTTISPSALINMLQKRKRFSGEMKTLYKQKFETSYHEKVKAQE